MKQDWGYNMAERLQKTWNNKPLYVAGAICAVCVLFMCAALLMPRQIKKGDFIPPSFAANAKQGVPNVPKELGWYTPQADGLNFKVSVCGEVVIRDGKADVYLTNYARNDVWIMARIMDESGTVFAESGIIKPGEYVQTMEFDKIPENGQTIYYKVMAYEPDTYYSAGSFPLETAAQIEG